MRYVMGLILGLGAFSGFLLQGEAMKPVAVLGVVVALVSLGVLLLTAALEKRPDKTPAPLPRQVSLIWVAFAGGVFLSWAVSSSIYFYRVSAAQDYVAQAVVVLEEIKSRDHAYPPTLPTSQLGEPPSILRGAECYSSDGAQYRFTFFEPAGLLGEFLNFEYFEFQSQERRWVHNRI